MLNCDNSFWRFSLAVYAEPGVAAECLALQTSLNIDVNALLFCAWLGSEKQTRLTDENLSAVDLCVRRWHSTVVEPLRAVRRTMKQMPEMAETAVQTLRADIARLELRAEQIEQAMLFDLAAGFGKGAAAVPAAAAIRHNVTVLLQRNIPSRGPAGADLPKAERLIAAATSYRDKNRSKA